MANKNTNTYYIEVIPAAPTYVVVDGDCLVQRIVNYLFDFQNCEQTMVVLQSLKGIATEYAVNVRYLGGTVLPTCNDTISDVFVYQLFQRLGFDKEKTIIELQYWGIDKVYYNPYNGKVLGIVEFLDRVKENFVDKGKDFLNALYEDMKCIYEK